MPNVGRRSWINFIKPLKEEHEKYDPNPQEDSKTMKEETLVDDGVVYFDTNKQPPYKCKNQYLCKRLHEKLEEDYNMEYHDKRGRIDEGRFAVVVKAKYLQRSIEQYLYVVENLEERDEKNAGIH